MLVVLFQLNKSIIIIISSIIVSGLFSKLYANHANMLAPPSTEMIEIKCLVASEKLT